jgi:hypothetical protein
MHFPPLSATQRVVIATGILALIASWVFPPVGVPITYGRLIQVSHKPFWSLGGEYLAIDTSRATGIAMVIVLATIGGVFLTSTRKS